METAFDWGMQWIISLQAAGGPALDAFFEGATFMGELEFYLIFVPILFWSVDAATGARVGFAFLVTAYVNPILKDLFDQPRPYQMNASVSDRTVEGSGMPSGHAQSSIFVWGVLAAQVNRRWFWVLAMVIAFFIGLSRVYLGVHFPHQVIAGWAVGAILLVLFLFFDPRIEYAIARLPLAQQLLVTLAVPLLLAIVYTHSDTVRSAAVMAGFGSGIVLCRRYVPFSAAGYWWQRVLRSIIGLIVLIALYVGLPFIFPGEESGELAYNISRFVRYGLLGLWIGLGAPWLFSLLRLTQTPASPPEPEAALN